MRERLSYSNVMSTIAVFVALGGTSYAAVKLGKGDVKKAHVAKSAITSPKVKDGSLRAKDFKAGELPAGQQGPAGPQGEPGDDFTLRTTLGPGETLTGVFAMPEASSRAWMHVNYRIPLPVSIPEFNAHSLDTTDPRTPECPGQGQAAPGHLCVYEVANLGVDLQTPTNPVAGSYGSASTGFSLWGSASDPQGYSYGSWAVTAPTAR